MNKGSYIVIEGASGSGKTSQINYLAKRLQSDGIPVKIFDEPDSSGDLTTRAIKRITNDARYLLNTKTSILLNNAARAQFLETIKSSTEQGVICLVDRNYLSSLTRYYYGYGNIQDYSLADSLIRFAVGQNEPDLTIILDVPVPELLQRLSETQSNPSQAGLLERIRAGYLWEAERRKLPIVFANKPINQVHEEIWKIVSSFLNRKPDNTTKKYVQTANHPTLSIAPTPRPISVSDAYLAKDQSGLFVTDSGHSYLENIVTDTTGSVYAFYDQLSPSTIAAAMARLSRRGDDLRITLLDEFINQQDKDNDLLRRVITAYGDDSVQQLAGIHLVVENASNLLTKKLEWGRLAAYLEQSTRYIYFDQKDRNGNYRYYTPKDLDKQTTRFYTSSMNKMFNNYSKVVRQLTEYITVHSSVPAKERDGAFKAAVRAQACDAARALLPVATTSTVGIYASGQATESLIMHLLSDELPEARHTGKTILKQARKVLPVFLERADKPERGGAIIAYRADTNSRMGQIGRQLTDKLTSSSDDGAVLTDYWPRNEMDLVADMLYEHSDLPIQTIRHIIQEWTYEQKAQVFKTYMGERLNRRHRPGRALEKAHYSWDILCDYGIFRDLQRHRMVDALSWQQLTPRYGYNVPEIIEQAGLSDLFDGGFDISLKLYSYLQTAGYDLESQYAVLLGNKMRWKVTYNAREAFHLHELRTSPQGHPSYRKLVNDMHFQLAAIHPLIAESMAFVNRNEDPELTRLAAEKYTQFKLAKLNHKT